MITEVPPDLAKQLALACKALQEIQEEKTEANKEFKRRLEVMQGEVNRLSKDILTGQKELFAGVEEGMNGLQKLADRDGTTMTLSCEGEELLKISPKPDGKSAGAN